MLRTDWLVALIVFPLFHMCARMTFWEFFGQVGSSFIIIVTCIDLTFTVSTTSTTSSTKKSKTKIKEIPTDDLVNGKNESSGPLKIKNIRKTRGKPVELPQSHVEIIKGIVYLPKQKKLSMNLFLCVTVSDRAETFSFPESNQAHAWKGKKCHQIDWRKTTPF